MGSGGSTLATQRNHTVDANRRKRKNTSSFSSPSHTDNEPSRTVSTSTKKKQKPQPPKQHEREQKLEKRKSGSRRKGKVLLTDSSSTYTTASAPSVESALTIDAPSSKAWTYTDTQYKDYDDNNTAELPVEPRRMSQRYSMNTENELRAAAPMVLYAQPAPPPQPQQQLQQQELPEYFFAPTKRIVNHTTMHNPYTGQNQNDFTVTRTSGTYDNTVHDPRYIFQQQQQEKEAYTPQTHPTPQSKKKIILNATVTYAQRGTKGNTEEEDDEDEDDANNADVPPSTSSSFFSLPAIDKTALMMQPNTSRTMEGDDGEDHTRSHNDPIHNDTSSMASSSTTANISIDAAYFQYMCTTMDAQEKKAKVVTEDETANHLFQFFNANYAHYTSTTESNHNSPRRNSTAEQTQNTDDVNHKNEAVNKNEHQNKKEAKQKRDMGDKKDYKDDSGPHNFGPEKEEARMPPLPPPLLVNSKNNNQLVTFSHTSTTTTTNNNNGNHLDNNSSNSNSNSYTSNSKNSFEEDHPPPTRRASLPLPIINNVTRNYNTNNNNSNTNNESMSNSSFENTPNNQNINGNRKLSMRRRTVSFTGPMYV